MKLPTPLWKTTIIFFVSLFLITAIYGLLFVYNSQSIPRRSPDELGSVLFIMAVFGLFGAVVGGLTGGIIGLVAKLFKKNILILCLKYGAVYGFMGILIIWFAGCWILAGGNTCMPQ